MLFSSGSECEEQIVKYLLLEMLTATHPALADIYSGRLLVQFPIMGKGGIVELPREQRKCSPGSVGRAF